MSTHEKPLDQAGVRDEDSLRHMALERIEARRGFRIRLAAYLVVNTLLVITWFVRQPLSAPTHPDATAKPSRMT